MKPSERICNLTDDELRAHLANFEKIAHWLNTPSKVAETFTGLAAAVTELLLRRQADNSEFRKIERSLAYTAACGELNMQFNYAKDDSHEDHYDWLDVADYQRGDSPETDDALTYLDSRGLIERDPEHPTWISIRDASEATA